MKSDINCANTYYFREANINRLVECRQHVLEWPMLTLARLSAADFQAVHLASAPAMLSDAANTILAP
jgi:hypothetical protein